MSNQSNGITPFYVEEGNIAAVKNLDAYDGPNGPNIWELHVKTTRGYWDSVQILEVNSIQQFFKTKLPVYKQVKKGKYQII